MARDQRDDRHVQLFHCCVINLRQHLRQQLQSVDNTYYTGEYRQTLFRGCQFRLRWTDAKLSPDKHCLESKFLDH